MIKSLHVAFIVNLQKSIIFNCSCCCSCGDIRLSMSVPWRFPVSPPTGTVPPVFCHSALVRHHMPPPILRSLTRRQS